MSPPPASALIWVHDDHLSPQSPALAKAGPEIPRVYVFDPAVMRGRRVGLKRLLFISDALTRIPNLTCWEGPTAAVLQSLGPRQVLTMATPCPALKQVMAEIRASGMVLLILAEPPLVPGEIRDLKRFSRYWQKAQSLARSPTGR